MKYRLLEKTAVHSAPSSTSPVVADLHSEDEIEVGEVCNSADEAWHSVTLADGRKGYIPAKTKGRKAILYAGILRRGGARLIDLVIAVPIWIAISTAFGLIWRAAGGESKTDTSPTSVLIVLSSSYLVSLVGIAAYFFLMESSAARGTVGKLALGLAVTDFSGNRISRNTALKRSTAMLLKPVVLFPLLLVGLSILFRADPGNPSGLLLTVVLLVVLFPPKKQGIHDTFAKTMVIQKTRH